MYRVRNSCCPQPYIQVKPLACAIITMLAKLDMTVKDINRCDRDEKDRSDTAHSFLIYVPEWSQALRPHSRDTLREESIFLVGCLQTEGQGPEQGPPPPQLGDIIPQIIIPKLLYRAGWAPQHVVNFASSAELSWCDP
jgi:hypothetical protein